MSLTVDEWARNLRLAQMRGAETAKNTEDCLRVVVARWQDTLVYRYHKGPWWTLDVWNPVLDPRIPRRAVEPQGRARLTFTNFTALWLREGTKYWLGEALETGRYTWSTLKSRCDGLKWLQRHLDEVGDAGPCLVSDQADLRAFVKGLINLIAKHRISGGGRAGQQLSGNPRRQAMTAIEQFFTFMYDNRNEVARALEDDRWLDLTPAHAVLFRPGDKPRMTNAKAPDLVLEGDVVRQIAEGAELLARPKSEGGMGDLAAFHALMLLIRTGRRVNEVLMMDFDPLYPLVGMPPSDGESGAMVARMKYQCTKIESSFPSTIPIDSEVVSIIRAQQEVSRQFATSMDYKGEPKFLFLGKLRNRNCQLAYPMQTFHLRLAELSERLDIRDSQGRRVTISKTHMFRHTAATNLLNAGVPLHVVMRYFGHKSSDMTLHYARTLAETAEKEFLNFKKVTADGRELDIRTSDLLDIVQLDRRVDRFLPNGLCLLPPRQQCSRGNACLTCDKFVTDASHLGELRRQLDDTRKLVQRRKIEFRERFGDDMPEDNVWLCGREAEIGSLQRIVTAVAESSGGDAIRGAGVSETGRDG